jgi:hypothetical protein
MLNEEGFPLATETVGQRDWETTVGGVSDGEPIAGYRRVTIIRIGRSAAHPEAVGLRRVNEAGNFGGGAGGIRPAALRRYYQNVSG